MFDMNKIGRKIAELRKANNMTQMELADKLGISFQAVSNWERGNTMPDVSKLPELAELFHVSIDELLNGEGALVEAVLSNTVDQYIEEGKMTGQEIADTLPLLKPNQAERVMDSVDVSSFEDISSLLPFMAPEKICALAKEYAEAEDKEFLNEMLPFLYEKDVVEIADKLLEKDEDITFCLPFMHETDVALFANKLMEQDKSINSLLPFMYESHVRDLAMKALEDGNSINSFLPFLTEDDVTQLALKVLSGKK